MKFQQLSPQNHTRKSSLHQFLATTSPLINRKDAEHVLKMRHQIKNSFPDQLAVLKGENPIQYEGNDSVLRARSHIFGIPSLLSPQLSFEIADKIEEEQRKIEINCQNNVPELKISVSSSTSRVYSRFSHRSTLKELEGWLKKKLSTLPQSESDILEYKNLIVGLGMKELVRLLKTRCEQEGQILQSLWNVMWKVCQEVIRYLANQLNLSRSNALQELNAVQETFVKRLGESNSQLSRMGEKLRAMSDQNTNLSDRLKKTIRSNKELKQQVAKSNDALEQFEREYMRVLEQNLVMQLPNQDRREWIRKMYSSIKEYKTRFANKMKSTVKQLVLEKAKIEGDELDIDFDLLEHVADYTFGKELQNYQTRLDHEFETKNTGVQATVETQDVRTQTLRIEYATRSTEVCPMSVEAEVQTLQDWISHDSLVKSNLKLKSNKQKLQTFLRSKPPSTRRDSYFSAKPNYRESQELSGNANDSQERPQRLLTQKQEFDRQNGNKENIHRNSGLINSNSIPTKNSQKLLRKASMAVKPGINGQNVGTNQLKLIRRGSLGSFQSMKFRTPRSREASLQQSNLPQLSSIIYDPNQVLEQKQSFSESSELSRPPGQEDDSSEQTNSPNGKSEGTQFPYSPRSSRSKFKRYTVSPSYNPIDEERRQRSGSQSSAKSSNSNQQAVNLKPLKTSSRADDSQIESPVQFVNNPFSTQTQTSKRMSLNGALVLKSNKLNRTRKSTMQGRASRFQPERFQPLNSSNTAFSKTDTELMTKLQRYNFPVLNKVKSTRNEFDYRQIMKDTTYTCHTNEKKMELAIEKEFVSVLVDLLKYYRKLKVLKPHSAALFLRNLQPLPMVFIQKFGQKYGVKMLAIKNFRQILAYLNQLKNKCAKYSLLHLLLFSDFKVLSADTLRLFLKLLNALDPQYTILKDNSISSAGRDLDQVQLKESAVVEACLPYFSEPPARSEHTPTVASYLLQTLRQLIEMQSAKFSKLSWLYAALDSQGLHFDVLATFVMNIHLKPELEIKLLKEALNACDYKAPDGHYEISEQKFTELLVTTEVLTPETIESAFSKYAWDHQQKIPTTVALTKLLSLESGVVVQRLVKHLMNTLSGSQTGSKEAESKLVWKYVQYYIISKRIETTTDDILGDWACLGTRQLLIASPDPVLFSI